MNGESLVAMLERQRRAAAAALAAAALDYFATGAAEEISRDEAAGAWRAVRLRPHVLRDVAHVSTATAVLGTELASPIVCASIAYQALAHREGEVATARGAHAANTLMIVPTRATRRIEDIAAALQGPWWFQVYVVRDRGLTRELVLRAAAAGATALVLTGDTPLAGRKPRQGDPPVPDDLYHINFREHVRDGADARDATMQDPSITLEAIAWLRETAGLPVAVKGVLRADDAVACVEAGAAGVVVSNHGGRQLDRTLSTAAALPQVAAALAGRAAVLVDGGIRSGVDVLIARALGADAALVGRPVIWALASEGTPGVARLLTALRDDLVHAMMLAGVADNAEITRDLIAS